MEPEASQTNGGHSGGKSIHLLNSHHFQLVCQRPAHGNSETIDLRGTHHHWEDDGQEGGLQDPEDGQTDDLDQGEEMDPPQGDVAQEGEVRLVFGGHQIQLDTLPELEQTAGGQAYRCPTHL